MSSENTHHIAACPACGQSATDNKTISEAWKLHQCSSCTHVYATTLPDNRRFESEDYVAWRGEANKELIETAQHRYQSFSAQAQPTPGRVLELGCSTGEVLGEFSRRGWQAVGSDFSQAALEVAGQRHRDIKFIQADDNQIVAEEGKFDLVMAFHVIEHVPDIDRLGKNFSKMCNPEGYVFLAFPYWDAWSRKALGDSWPDLATEHLHFFTRKSIRLWLEKNDFELVHEQSWGRAWQWLGGIKRLVRGGKKGIDAHDTTQAAPTMPSPGKYTMIRTLEKMLRPFLALEEARCAGSELAVIAKRKSN